MVKYFVMLYNPDNVTPIPLMRNVFHIDLIKRLEAAGIVVKRKKNLKRLTGG